MFYYDYSFFSFAISASAEWTSVMREEALGMTDTSEDSSKPAARSRLVTLAIVTSLFMIFLGAFAFSSIGVSKFNQPLVSTQIGGSQNLK